MKTRSAIVWIIVILLFMLLVGCAPAGEYLKWKQIDAAELMKSEAGKRAYNTIRFETYGPKPQQLFGYILYKDGIKIDMGTGIPVTKLGKKTLSEVIADYRNVEKERMYTVGSNLIIREIYRENTVVAYTAADINIRVNVWDITEEGGVPTLRLVYEDLREYRESIDRGIRIDGKP